MSSTANTVPAPQSPPSARTRVRRSANRAVHDTATLYAILDAAWVCHVAFHDDHGTHCIPTACWRDGDHLYIHGSNGSRMMKRLAQGADTCVTVTHVDGLVLARSAFNHSMNYRSAMVYGHFELVPEDGKRPAMEAMMEHLIPGRQPLVRTGSDKEYAATTVLRIALDEAAAKVRSGGPVDDDGDLAWPVWAGVLPLRQQALAAEPAPDCPLPAPAHVRDWSAAQSSTTPAGAAAGEYA
jgi:nitroimidazol reductase NimA-like FMN-containing flavoprotein (pyridoxamine 5'-phosphate oxidase superfamily)